MTDPRDDFAPGGSDRRKVTNLSRPEQLPPGRRNQASDRPVNPRAGALERIEAVRADEAKGVTPSRPARKRASRAIEPEQLPAAPPPEPEPVQSQLADLADYEDDEPLLADPVEAIRATMPASDAKVIEALAEAVMVAMRCRIIGEQPGATWEDFDSAAEEALLLMAPVDPYESMSNVQRFVWGDTGLMNLPEQISSGEEIADILRLGEFVREVEG